MGMIEKNKIKDLYALISLLFLAVSLSLFFKTGVLASTLLFLGLPSGYLSLRYRKAVIKTFLFSLIFSVPFFFIIDYLAVLNKSWYLPKTIFPILFMGHPLEGYFWGFLFVYSVVIFYEYFFDRTGREKIGQNLKYFVWGVIAALILFIILFLVQPELLRIDYFYFWLGLFLIFAPVILFLSRFPRLTPKFIGVGLFFLPSYTLHELVGLFLNQWQFSGTHFIGWIQLFSFKFPVEELVFFILLSSPAILTYYELFDDDRK